MRDWPKLLNTVSQQATQGMKPVTVQTGIVTDSPPEVRLEQNLEITPTLPKHYTADGLKIHVKGTLNGESVEGDLVLTCNLEQGDLVKIIKEDGVNRFFMAGKL